MDVKPYWFFVVGLLFLYVFAAIAVRSPRRHLGSPRPYPGPAPMLGPGGTRQTFYEQSLEQFASGGATFYMFGVDWCPHCQTAKPEFENLGATKTIGEQTVAMVYVNPEKEPQKKAGFDIQGYPTLILQTADGSKVPYKGPRTTAGFEQFLQSQLK
jgi:thiol-disulfide isomerase/thioredoxin